MAGIAVRGIRDQLTLVQVAAVCTVTAILTLAEIETILDSETAGAKIGIFAEGQKNVVLAVFIVELEGGSLRNDAKQFVELLEERTVEIDLPSVVRRIPLIRPPAIGAVHRITAVRRKSGDHCLLAESADAFVQMPLVTPRQPALLTAIRALRRRRDEFLFATEDR